MGVGTEVERLTVSLVGEDSSYTKMLSSASKNIKTTEKDVKSSGSAIEGVSGSIKALGAAVAAYMASRAVSSFLTNSFSAFSSQETAMSRLSTLVRLNNRDISSSLDRYRAFAREMRTLSGTSESVTLGLVSQAEALGVTGDSAQRAVRNASALASTFGGDIQQYIRATIDLQQGQADALTSYIPQLRLIPDPIMRAAEAQRVLNQMMEVTSGNTNTMQTRVNRFWAAFERIRENIGAVVSAIFEPFLDSFTRGAEGFERWTDGIRANITTIRDYATRAWTWMSDTATAAWRELQPIVSAVGGFIMSVVTTVSDAVGSIWASHGSNVGQIWNTIRETVVDTFIALEFAVRNWGTIAEATWTDTKLGFVSFVNVVHHFFTVTIPVTFDWFTRNWREIFTDIYNWTTTVFSNLSTNVVNVFSNLPALIAGTMDFSEVWRPLQEGFRRTSETLVIPERVEGNLERQLREQSERQWRTIRGSYEEFRRRRRSEIAGNPATSSPLLPTPNQARDAGRTTGEEFNRGLAQGLSKVDAALSGSAEALGRVQEYYDRFQRPLLSIGLGNANRNGGAQAAQGAPAFVGPPAPVRAASSPSSPQGKTNSEWLKKIAEILTNMNSKQAINLSSGNLSNG